MTTKELKQYRFCKKRILELNEEIDRLRNENSVHDAVQGSQKEYPYILRTSGVDGCPEYSDAIEKINRLYEERRRCKKAVKDITSFVYGIEDGIIRRAVIIRYMEGDTLPKWDKVALKIGGGNTADGIRMTVSRFLKKI